MTAGQIEKIIEGLREDENYYGDYGRRFVSNSDVKTLLENPVMYGQPRVKTGAMLMGTYIHDKLQGRPTQTEFISSETSRNAKKYKEQAAANGGIIMLQKEVEIITPVLNKVLANEEFMSYILGGNIQEGQIEQPAVGEIFGIYFKAKADRLNLEQGYVIDIKTTSDIEKFRSSFFKYGYDTQAYIYEVLFKLPMLFAVLDKGTGQVGLFTVSRDTLINAESKVMRAVKIRELYHGANPTMDIDKYIMRHEL